MSALTRQAGEMTAVAAFVRVLPSPGGPLGICCPTGSTWVIEDVSSPRTRDSALWAARVAGANPPRTVHVEGRPREVWTRDPLGGLVTTYLAELDWRLTLTWYLPLLHLDGRGLPVRLVVDGVDQPMWDAARAAVSAETAAHRRTASEPTGQPDLFAGAL